MGGSLIPTPANVTISQPSAFLGDRVTEPRCLSLLRVERKDPNGSFNYQMFLGCTHLTVLRDELDVAQHRRGSDIRQEQVRAIIQVLRQLPPRIPIILAGDFNAELPSPELIQLNAILQPVTHFCLSRDKREGTHKKHHVFVDHIWAAPDKFLTVKQCGIAYRLQEVSDHWPVYAELAFSVGESGSTERT